jgi:hypothetical protein
LRVINRGPGTATLHAVRGVRSPAAEQDDADQPEELSFEELTAEPPAKHRVRRAPGWLDDVDEG